MAHKLVFRSKASRKKKYLPSGVHLPRPMPSPHSAFGLFRSGRNGRIYSRGVGSPVLASATADGSGSFTATASNPAWPNGPRLFFGVGQTSGKLGAADFWVNPLLILNPNAGAVGSTATAYGSGFLPFQKVKITWLNPRTVLGTAKADLNGNFKGSAALTFTVPTGAPLGVNKVSAGDAVANAKASFTVQ
jgi:hypothetical protein